MSHTNRPSLPFHRNSVEGAQAILKAADQPALPVFEISEEAQKYFDVLVTTRAAFDWLQGELVMLARLSEALALSDRLQDKVDSDGFLFEDRFGKYYANPAMPMVNAVENRIIRLCTRLGVMTPINGAVGDDIKKTAQQVEQTQHVNDDSGLME